MTSPKQYYDIQSTLQSHAAYNDFQQVVPGLFIGGQNSALAISKLHENNIKRILKVNGVESSIRFSNFGIDLKILDIDDMPDFNIRPYFEEAHAFIHSGMSRNEGVLVVCTAGISRSAAIVISYLIRYRHMTFDEAFQTTKRGRVYIALSGYV